MVCFPFCEYQKAGGTGLLENGLCIFAKECGWIKLENHVLYDSPHVLLFATQPRDQPYTLRFHSFHRPSA
jgi:hypothetical protein